MQRPLACLAFGVAACAAEPVESQLTSDLLAYPDNASHLPDDQSLNDQVVAY